MAGADPGVPTLTEPDHDPSAPPHDRGHAGPQPVARHATQLPGNYLYAIARFARHFGASPAELGPENVRAYLTHLIAQQISFSYFNMIVAALRFLYTVTLQRDGAVPKLPYQKKERRLPTVLSVEEVSRFLGAIPDLKMRTVLVTAYAAGLRVFEVVALRPSDIDSQRMVLRVAQGKGRKERLVMLSPRLLELLGLCGHYCTNTR
jgi:integrase/recombinase XerD